MTTPQAAISSARPRTFILVPAAALQLCVGILYMWSVFQPHVVRHFGWDFQVTAGTSSIMLFAFVAGTLAGGFLLDRSGTRPVVTLGSLVFSAGILATSFLGSREPRLIHLTYGLVAGTGTGLVYGGVVSCVQRWYPRRRGFAAGVAAGAFGFSVVILSPLAETLVGAIGLPRTFRLLGMVFLAITLTASRFISDPPETAAPKAEPARDGRPGRPVSGGASEAEPVGGPGGAASAEKAPAGARQYRPREVLASPIFWCVFLCLFFEVAAWVVILPIIKTLALARGMSRELALAAVMVTGIANASGRVASAWISDRIGRGRTVVLLCLITCGASLWLVGAAGIPYVVAVFLVAFAYGGPSGVFPPLVREVFGEKHAGTNFGMVLMALGCSSLVFSRVSGILSAGAASSGDYSASFFLTAALGAAAAACMLAAEKLWAVDGEQGTVNSEQ